MTIAAGTHLGSYEILAPIGAGGMGEVYRAHDTKLGRDVAIPVLPETFAHDPERLSWFQREAKMLASLNHPKHRGDLRTGGGRQQELSGDGAGSGRDAAGANCQGRSALRRRSARHLPPDRRGTGSRSREGHRSPRPETRQREGVFAF
jgi:serine/threonine protein kinase